MIDITERTASNFLVQMKICALQIITVVQLSKPPDTVPTSSGLSSAKQSRQQQLQGTLERDV